jgi:DNA invertase Pin-like site-specific DNA recombinase
MKGIIYVRVSSEEQVKGTSLENQDELCRAYCKSKGIEVVGIYREEGASAKTAQRAEFLRAIEFCRKNKGKIDAFVVYKVDRFARNTEDHFYVRKMLIEYGVSLHSVTEPIGNNPIEKFIETVLAGSAEFDNSIRTQRCVDGMMARLNKGISPFKPPVGYESQRAKKRGEKKNTPDKPDKKTFPIIQQGLKAFSSGYYTQAEMKTLFDKLGLAEIRGKKTSSQFVSKIFTKYLKFYAGILVNPWTKEEVKGLHKPMITREELFKIQMLLSGKKMNVKHIRKNPEFPLRGTIICAYCGRPLTGSFSSGKGIKYPYYHCYNKQCANYGKGLSKKLMEEEFVKYLNSITPKEDFLRAFNGTVLNLWKERCLSLKKDVESYEETLAALEKKRKKIFEMREEGSYKLEEFLERKGEIENMITSVKISLSETRIDQFDIEGTLAYATNFISNLGRQWLDLAVSHLQFQKMVFPDGISYKKNIGFGNHRLGFIYELSRNFETQKSPVVVLSLIDWKELVLHLKQWHELKECFSLIS